MPRFEWVDRFFRRDRQSVQPRQPANVPDGVRIYAIGDIHGRSDLLKRLHGLIEADFAANPAHDVRLVYLGDYVDRGSDSSGVLEILAEGPSDLVKAEQLLGNHEEMFLRFMEDPSIGPTWRQLGGFETLLSYGIDVGPVLAADGYPGLSQRARRALPAHHREFLAQLQPSVSIGDYFFCHAGVRPGVPLDQQRSQDLLWIRDAFLTATEDFGKVIVHGHSPTDKPDIRANRINIDTGAYATGRLTCLVLQGGDRRFLST